MKNYAKRLATTTILATGAAAALIWFHGSVDVPASADEKTTDLKQYLANLSLSDQPFRQESSRSESVERNTVPVPEDLDLDNLQAVVDGKSLLSFVDRVSRQQKEDVLISVLLAQRAANYDYNSSDEIESWYGKFAEVLGQVGWLVEDKPFKRIHENQNEFLMDKQALKAIESIATEGGLDLVKGVLTALNTASNDQQLELFETHSTSGTFGNFQLGTAGVTKKGDVVLILGSFYFRTTAERRRFLFFTWKSKDLEFWASAQKMILVEAIYSAVRDRIKDKATAGTRRYVSELRLGD